MTPRESDVQASSTDDEFWQRRRVLLTGHTGFKGAWLHLWLRTMGAEVTGYALPPSSEPNLWDMIGSGGRSIIADVRDAARLRAVVAEAHPHVVIHMAAQALVRESYRDPLGTYGTNVMGTAGLLEACRSARDLECVVVVTSDKVYANRGAGRPFIEEDRLGGHDPYSNSKACAELVTSSFRDSFYAAGPPIASARAGNVIGGGDWSADRLIPDCVRALAAGVPVRLRYPEAVRPWQHVLEPLSGYLTLARALSEKPASAPRAVNFGPEAASFCPVYAVVEAFSTRFGGKPGWERDRTAHPAEAGSLTLESALAARTLEWRPTLSLEESLSWTSDWYQAHAAGRNMLAITEAQLANYRLKAARAPAGSP